MLFVQDFLAATMDSLHIARAVAVGSPFEQST